MNRFLFTIKKILPKNQFVRSITVVAGGAVVNKDVPDYALMVGVPARQIGWMSEFGEQLDLPLEGNAKTTCPQTGTQYELTGTQLIRL